MKITYSDVSMPSVFPSAAGVDSSAGVADVPSASTTVVVFFTSSVVVVAAAGVIVSEPDGAASFAVPFSVVSVSVDGTTTVDSVVFVTGVTVVPLTASELAFRLFDVCLKLV